MQMATKRSRVMAVRVSGVTKLYTDVTVKNIRQDHMCTVIWKKLKISKRSVIIKLRQSDSKVLANRM